MDNKAYMADIDAQSLADLIYACHTHSDYHALICLSEHIKVNEFAESLMNQLQMVPNGNVFNFDNHSSIRVLSRHDRFALNGRHFNAILVEDNMDTDSIIRLGDHMEDYREIWFSPDVRPDYYLFDIDYKKEFTHDTDDTDALSAFLSNYTPQEDSNATE
mgnify:CR=1 FL=1